MTKPRVALLHYTAPPVIGGVETVIAEHARLFSAAGYPVTVIAGRGGASGLPEAAAVRIIPEIDSEYPENLAIAAALARDEIPAGLGELCDRIESRLAEALGEAEVVIAHNVMTMHFNLPLIAALHRLADRGAAWRWIVWAHDISRYVNPASGSTQRSGFPWALLRRERPEFTYVAVSSQRQRLLAEVLGCAPERILVVPNGVNPHVLLGLSEVGRRLVEEFGLLEADLVILMPIRITRAKNIEFALRVTAAIKTAGLRPKLVVTGPPDPHTYEIAAYFDELRGLRRDLGLEAEAFFIYEGTVKTSRFLTLKPEAVAELYRMCDLVLMTSHREGFGLPVLEAGLMDKAVFATAVPVLEDLGAGLVYSLQPDEPPEQVAARMIAWAERDTTHCLRRRVRQGYTWSAIFARHVAPLVAGMVENREGGPT